MTEHHGECGSRLCNHGNCLECSPCQHCDGGDDRHDKYFGEDEELAPDVDMADAEAYGDTVPEDGRWRPHPVYSRGRWRTKKRVLRQLAADLGYPECMEVAHRDQIDGAVLQAGVRLCDFYKLHRTRDRPFNTALDKAYARRLRSDRRESRRRSAAGEIPF